MPDSEPSPPPDLRAHLDQAERALSAAGGLVLCSDFDGTLAPIETDPAGPTLSAERRDLLETLADHPAVAVALVSGRSLADLTERAAVDGATYAGNHGLERRHDDDRTVPAGAPDRETVATAADALSEQLADVDGALVEDKGLSLTVHYRAVESATAADRVREVAHDVTASTDELTVFDGKQVYELRPDSVDKGSAVAAVCDRHPDDWLAAYLGDDDSDEAAFRQLGPDALTVHVGDRVGTAARYRLAEPADMTAFLRWLRSDGLDALEASQSSRTHPGNPEES